jgi:choline dehydrogenase-like flavoprotein
MSDILIIGSGPAGAAAALQLAARGIRPRMLDAGLEPDSSPPLNENIYDYCARTDGFDVLIGRDFEGLYNLDPRNPEMPAKLTAPRMSYVAARGQGLAPLRQSEFSLVQSFSLGGLANAWGAGLMRFTNRDLAGFPINEKTLSPYYGRLEQEIGISGAEDDLLPFFGEESSLQPPLRLSANSSLLMKNYLRRKAGLNRKGIYLGRPRLGVLTEDKDGRPAFDYKNLEFWQPGIEAIYSPAMTVKRLSSEGRLDYIPGRLALSWTRSEGRLTVRARRLGDGGHETFTCGNLVLAAGAVNSARLVLASRMDHDTRLTLLDNPALQFPLFFPKRVGARLETDAFGLTQLILICDWKEYGLIQGSFLELTSPPRAEFFGRFPLAARDNIRLLRWILPALMVIQVFLPLNREGGSSFRLSPDGLLEIEGHPYPFSKDMIGGLSRAFRSLGALTLRPFVVKVPPGHGIHYAGTLPMSAHPQSPYECTTDGELSGEPGVFVADAALFPALPAKNFSLAVMANAMRIADSIADRKGA